MCCCSVMPWNCLRCLFRHFFSISALQMWQWMRFLNLLFLAITKVLSSFLTEEQFSWNSLSNNLTVLVWDCFYLLVFSFVIATLELATPKLCGDCIIWWLWACIVGWPWRYRTDGWMRGVSSDFGYSKFLRYSSEFTACLSGDSKTATKLTSDSILPWNDLDRSPRSRDCLERML